MTLTFNECNIFNCIMFLMCCMSSTGLKVLCFLFLIVLVTSASHCSAIINQQWWILIALIVFFIVALSWWKLSPCLSLTAPRFSGRKCRKWFFRDMSLMAFYAVSQSAKCTLVLCSCLENFQCHHSMLSGQFSLVAPTDLQTACHWCICICSVFQLYLVYWLHMCAA